MLCPKSSSSCSFLRLNSTLNNSGFFLVLSPCLISPPALKPKLFHVFGRPYYTVITVERARSLPWGRVMLKLVPGQKIKKKKREREREISSWLLQFQFYLSKCCSLKLHPFFKILWRNLSAAYYKAQLEGKRVGGPWGTECRKVSDSVCPGVWGIVVLWETLTLPLCSSCTQPP